MIPSVKTIMRLRYFDGAPITRVDAKCIRSVFELAEYRVDIGGYRPQCMRDALEKIDLIIGGCGIESINPGNNANSPGIDYVNMGDTYATTVMVIRGRFRVGCWGDVVERGNYA